MPSGKKSIFNCVCNWDAVTCSKKKCRPCHPCTGWEESGRHWRQCCAGATENNGQMIINGTTSGKEVRILVDTGASISFVSKKFIKSHDLHTENCDEMQIRLGDNSTAMVRRIYKDILYLGDDIPFEVEFYVMPDLPSTFDVILGMDWMIKHDAWIHPATGRVSAVLEEKEHMFNFIDLSESRQVSEPAREIRTTCTTDGTADTTIPQYTAAVRVGTCIQGYKTVRIGTRGMKSATDSGENTDDTTADDAPVEGDSIGKHCTRF